MKTRNIILSACMALFLLVGTVPAFALFVDFENGVDGNAIGSTVPGLVFNPELLYADKRTGDYAIKPDALNPSFEWQYVIGGNLAALNLDTNYGEITILGPASYFSIGYSSYFPFMVDVYDSSGLCLQSISKPANSREWDGDQLSYIEISQPNISFVRFYDFQGEGFDPTPGYWLVDNITVRAGNNTIVPEWSTALLALLGLPAVLRFRRLQA